MSDHKLYPIGAAARRSGLSVSAVRFYSDAGIIAPTGLNDAGHRMYDIDAVARLELVRTLRELDTDLEEIRRLLEGSTTLHDLLAANLAVVEGQERALRARRAVLRTLLRQGGTTAQADLMHKLASMADEERERVVDGFWDEVSDGLEVPEGLVDRLRSMRPVLPADPTAAQLEAWIELADLVGRPEFRDAVRANLRDVYCRPEISPMTTDSVQSFIYESGSALAEELFAAQRAGEPPRSRRSQRAVTRFMEAALALGEDPRLTPETRNRMAEGFRQIPELMREMAEEEAASVSPGHDETHGRYLALVARINGTEAEEDPDAIPYAWIADAMRAPAPRTPHVPAD